MGNRAGSTPVTRTKKTTAAPLWGVAVGFLWSRQGANRIRHPVTRTQKVSQETKVKAIGEFIFRAQEWDALTEFDEQLRLIMINRVTVRHDGRMVFRFQSGVEISL